MLSKQDFIKVSMEVNLFFQRIMKEHLFFIEANLQPAASDYIAKASELKQHFEQLLAETVYHTNGVMSENAIESNELVTPYTLRAEEVTSMLTGARINTGITKVEYELRSIPEFHKEGLENSVYDLNRRSAELLEGVIAFQKMLLTLISECRIFISLYPEMLEHVTREAEYYLELLKNLLANKLPDMTPFQELDFWNNIMGEHAQFIDGMLDPTQKDLKASAKAYADRFEKLVEECIRTAERQAIQNSIEAAKGIRDYKKAATEGLLRCNIKSIIPPLLADHVLREANYYLRLLMIR